MRKRYLEGPQALIDENLVEIQFQPACSDATRTQQSSASFQQAFLSKSKSSLILKERQRRSLRIIGRGLPPINIDASIQTKLDLSNDTIPGNPPSQVYQVSVGQNIKDRLNLFSCPLLKNMHLFLHNYQSENNVWKSVFQHYKRTGIYETMANVTGQNAMLFDVLGFQLAYSTSTTLLALREQMPLNSTLFKNMTYSDWDQVERVWLTHQWGIWDKFMIDVKNTRAFYFFLQKFEEKIQCIVKFGVNSTECRKREQYWAGFYHDVDMQPFANLFDLEQQWVFAGYSATMILELHLDEQKLAQNLCSVNPHECFHIKVFLNNLQLFNELSYCDYITQQCSYAKFHEDMMHKLMIGQFDVDMVCYEPFQPERLRRHKVYLQ
eukprot:403373747